MNIDSVEMGLIPGCSWHRAVYSPSYRSRIGTVVVELTSVVARRLGVKRGKWSRVASKAKCRETTTECARDCHRYHSLSEWSKLAFPLFER